MTTEAPVRSGARGRSRRRRRGSRRARAEPDRGRRLAPDVPGRGRRRAALGAPARAGRGDVVRLARGRARGRSRPPTWRGWRSRRTVCFEPAGGRFGAGAGYRWSSSPGTSVAPRVLRRDELATARERLPGQLAAALAQIHSVEPGAVEGLAGGAADPALEACELWEAELDAIGEPLPAVEAGLRWLRLNPPPPAEPRLVHGDFRLGNLIVDEHGLAAVIDWELCHAGDPAEDLGLARDPLLALRQRRAPGRRAGGDWSRSWRPTRRPAARARMPSGCAGGRRWATSSGR